MKGETQLLLLMCYLEFCTNSTAENLAVLENILASTSFSNTSSLSLCFCFNKSHEATALHSCPSFMAEGGNKRPVAKAAGESQSCASSLCTPTLSRMHDGDTTVQTPCWNYQYHIIRKHSNGRNTEPHVHSIPFFNGSLHFKYNKPELLLSCDTICVY